MDQAVIGSSTPKTRRSERLADQLWRQASVNRLTAQIVAVRRLRSGFMLTIDDGEDSASFLKGKVDEL